MVKMVYEMVTMIAGFLVVTQHAEAWQWHRVVLTHRRDWSLLQQAQRADYLLSLIHI